MVGKCCIPRCRSNYKKNGEKVPYVSIYSFPKDPVERAQWLELIPRENYNVTQNSYVCIKHWPPNVKFKSCRGKNFRPVCPPTIFSPLETISVEIVPDNPNKVGES